MRAKWVTATALLCVGATIGGPVSSATDAPATAPDVVETWEAVGRGLGELEWKDSSNGMEGLTEVGVWVFVGDELGKALSISASEIKTQTELYLRKIPGLAVVDTTLGPTSTVRVGVEGLLDKRKDGSLLGGFGATVSMDLYQQVLLLRPPQGLRVGAVTWEGSYSMTGPTDTHAAPQVRDTLNKSLDKFQNEFLKANPQIKP